MKTMISVGLSLVFATLNGLAAPAVVQAQPEVSFPVNECIYAWTAKYHRNGTAVTVRIKLAPESGVTTTLAVLQARWKSGIEAKWSDKLHCTGGSANLTFAVQWVTSGEHHAVTVKAGSGRANLSNWYEQSDGNTAAHEFGHMLGMKDEYTDPNCPDRYPVNTNTVMHVTSGPIVQRYIDAVCQGVPGEPIAAEQNYASERGKENAMVPADIQKNTVRIRLVVSGGEPGSRLQWETVVNEESKSVYLSYFDESKGAGRGESTGELTAASLKGLKTAINARLLRADEMIGGPFVPGTIVGTLTIEAGGRTKMIRYAVDERKVEGWGEPDAEAIKSINDDETASAIKNLHRFLVEQARQSGKR